MKISFIIFEIRFFTSVLVTNKTCMKRNETKREKQGGEKAKREHKCAHSDTN